MKSSLLHFQMLQARTKPKAGSAAVDLTTGLVASWDLDEASGTRVDQSGNGYDLTDNNTVTQAAGVGAGQFAAEFVAANSEYLSIASNADLQIGNRDWTMALWANVGFVSGFQLFSKGNSGIAGGEFHLQGIRDSGNGTHILQFRVRQVGDAATVTVQQPGALGVLANTFGLIFVGYDATAEEIFVASNLNTLSSASMPGGSHVGTNELWLGRNATTHFTGFCQAARIWHRALTADERTTLYNGGTAALLHADF